MTATSTSDANTHGRRPSRGAADSSAGIVALPP